MNRKITTGVSAAVLVGLATVALTACSSQDGTSTSPSADTLTADAASLEPPAKTGMEKAMNGTEQSILKVADVSTADGWAAATVLSTPAEYAGTPEANDYAIEVPMAFTVENGAWVAQDRMAVCGTQDPNDLQAYPNDARIPSALYSQVCTNT